ncbi:MAG: hypothetical protein IJ277_02410 [Bacteroidaceae bacterium]|nr:hypothetical protein [Bacteroidaceae bacterium]
MSNSILRKQQSWPTPKLYGVGHFTEYNLYKEALSIALSKGFISKDVLIREIPQRIKGLIVVDSISKTSYQDLIRELLYYDFIAKNNDGIDKYVITEDGEKFLQLCEDNKEDAMDFLLGVMQKVFVTPAWFVARLWELNPSGQGQLVIPLPIKEWHPKSKKWSENAWTDELEIISLKTIDRIKKRIPGSFPFEEDKWIEELKTEYIRLGKQHPKTNNLDIDEWDVQYSQRNRLSLAMKTVAVRKFFSRENPKTRQMDFPNKRSDMTHRSFMVWCPRLEAFDMIFYTDNHPDISGRLLFPISVFKEQLDSQKYVIKTEVKNISGVPLSVHMPKWETTKSLFIETLIEVYQRYYDKQTIIYISLQDIRDEVCRLLRISPKLFELFLQKTYELSIQREIRYSISLETDLRLDMKVQINRRGVYLNGIMYSLIAVKPLEI